MGFAENQVTVAELLNNKEQFDGQQITLNVEAIGDLMKRGDVYVVNGLDETGAIGIWLNEDDANEITKLGSYQSTGDMIRVEGIYHYNCNEHGGDTDIHAERLEREKPGFDVVRKVDKNKKIAFLSTTLVLLMMGSYYYFGILKREQ